MLDFKDCTLTVAINGFEIDSLVQIGTVKVTESLHHLVPFGILICHDNSDFFNKAQLVGGEKLWLIEHKKGTDESITMIFTILFVENLGDKTKILHFVLDKPQLLETKRSRAFKNRSVSEVITDIIKVGQGDTVVHISNAVPRKTWIQPYWTDGQFIHYLKNQCYYNERFNFYAWYTLRNEFNFRSYEELALEKTPEGSYQISDAIIRNPRFFDVMKNFGRRVIFFDIKTNRFSKKTYQSPATTESMFSIQRTEDAETIASIMDLPSTNNGSVFDYQDIGLKKDDSFIVLEYNFADTLSPLKLGDNFNLEIMSKTLKDSGTDMKQNQFLNGKWIVGEIEKEYSTSGQMNKISFLKKGIDWTSDRLVS